MKVMVAINGSLVSESCAYLALNYAKKKDIDLVLVHIKNDKDLLSDVEASSSKIEQTSQSLGVDCTTVILKGPSNKALRSYLKNIHVDTIFCTTRRQKSFITNSFSEHLLKMKLNTNIAIVRIVYAHNFKELRTILLPIKGTKLSVYKFTFLATLASAYMSNAHIYSISTASQHKLSKFTLAYLRERLSHINFELRHYISLSKLMPFTLNIKHDFSNNENKSILNYIANYDSPLVIIGAKRLTFFSLFKGEPPIEELMRETSANMIAFYPKEAKDASI